MGILTDTFVFQYNLFLREVHVTIANMSGKSKLSTESYKGVRDFYPEDLFVEEHIFKIWKDVVESFGYQKYDASILEPAELYKAKSGEEIVNEQTYTFTDRGGREVTLRPEMTPTVARMVAAKEKELTFPLRWYSIPNLFRYEKPQKGRLREHWQLNVDLFGVDSIEADAEIITVAYQIMKKFGAKDEDFVLKVNNRKIINQLYAKFDLNEEQSYSVSKIIDKKEKISKDAFVTSLSEIIGEKAKDFALLLESDEKLLDFLGKNVDSDTLISLIEKLNNSGIKNVVFDPNLMRGFDYYTSIVFEVFDTNPENRRSVFGGGRYDDLLDIFGARKIPAVGFGAGDVTMRDFIETRKLLPTYKAENVRIVLTDEKYREQADKLAVEIRSYGGTGPTASIDISGKKLADQIRLADKQRVSSIIAIGENEVSANTYKVKNMANGEEKEAKTPEEVAKIVKENAQGSI